MKSFQNLSSCFRQEDVLRISSCPYGAKSLLLSPYGDHVFQRIKILQTIFEKGSPEEQSCEIISKSEKLFQRRRISLKSIQRKKASPSHGGHVFRRIKISQTIFEKGHTTNNLVKLFQILTNSFGEEDFLRISSWPYSAKSLPAPMVAMFFNRSKFREQLLKKVTQGTIL